MRLDGVVLRARGRSSPVGHRMTVFPELRCAAPAARPGALRTGPLAPGVGADVHNLVPDREADVHTWMPLNSVELRCPIRELAKWARLGPQAPSACCPPVFPDSV
ncbi:hypothetical protein GCM10010289_05560 [Streptomyces violascens]|uniref:Uncharacterized protein n=1 Tax=Streptomyces violascens TaxID=67381 RepID=A0ABQ3QG69_9ACTN|nr:hypothetical protein GCM10010289_05560 [Streptomyces violascens]GHI36222.1 hypothetical protein Sviol_06300 [Streptomyces violascens]